MTPVIGYVVATSWDFAKGYAAFCSAILLLPLMAGRESRGWLRLAASSIQYNHVLSKCIALLHLP